MIPGLSKVCVIAVPPDDDAPVIPPVMVPIVQLNAVPDTLPDNAIFVAVPLQIVVGLAVNTFGVGFTVTVTVKLLPGQGMEVVVVTV